MGFKIYYTIFYSFVYIHGTSDIFFFWSTLNTYTFKILYQLQGALLLDTSMILISPTDI